MAARFDHLLPVYTDDELAAEVWATCLVYGRPWDEYEVSNLGRVRNVRRGGRILKPLWCHAVRGEASVYWRVCMSRGKPRRRVRKAFLIHRLVAEAFVPGRTRFRNVAHHLDHCTFNPRASNLAWVTFSQNTSAWYTYARNRRALEAEERRLAEEAELAAQEAGAPTVAELLAELAAADPDPVPVEDAPF